MNRRSGSIWVLLMLIASREDDSILLLIEASGGRSATDFFSNRHFPPSRCQLGTSIVRSPSSFVLPDSTVSSASLLSSTRGRVRWYFTPGTRPSARKRPSRLVVTFPPAGKNGESDRLLIA